MKKLFKTTISKLSIYVGLIVGIALLATVNIQAQTNNLEGTFLSSAESYFSSFNTNADQNWTNVSLEVATGYKQVSGVNAASTLDAQYDWGRLNAGGAFQFSGVGSPVNAFEGQFGYDLIEHYDFKAEIDLRAGYDWNLNTEVVEPALFLKKKPTANTFFEIGVSLPYYFKGSFNRNPTFFSEVGFTY